MQDEFLVVAQVLAPSSNQRKIEGRIYNGVSATMGGSQGAGSFGISGSLDTKDMTNPDVGGWSGTGLLNFAVVWERNWAAGDHDILYRFVAPGGGGVGTGYLAVDPSFNTLDTDPSISKVNHQDDWNVVWQRQNGSHHDLRAARIGENGQLSAFSFSVDGSISDTQFPTASSCLAGTDRWMIACHEFLSGSWDITLRALDGATVIDAINLMSLETLAGSSFNQFRTQLRPDVESDGEAFAIAYTETTDNPSNLDTFVSTVALTGNKINLSEGHRILAGSFTSEDHVSIASRGAMGGGLRRHMVVWENLVNPALHANIEGGLYDEALYTSFCHPGFDVAPCPCGNPPANFQRGCNNSSNTGGGQLSLLGLSSFSGDTLNLFAGFLKPNALAIFNQGDAVLPGAVPFGQGMRCVGGAIKRLYMTTALSGGTASVPQSGDPVVHTRSAALGDVITPGSTRAYYVYYRDPVVLGGCPSGNTYNATQSVQAIWIP